MATSAIAASKNPPSLYTHSSRRTKNANGRNWLKRQSLRIAAEMVEMKANRGSMGQAQSRGEVVVLMARKKHGRW